GGGSADARLGRASIIPKLAAALARRHEQGLGSRERNRARLGEQILRQLRRQSGQQTFRSGNWLRHRQSSPFNWTHPQSYFGRYIIAKGPHLREPYAGIYAHDSIRKVTRIE